MDRDVIAACGRLCEAAMAEFDRALLAGEYEEAHFAESDARHYARIAFAECIPTGDHWS